MDALGSTVGSQVPELHRITSAKSYHSQFLINFDQSLVKLLFQVSSLYQIRIEFWAFPD